MSLARGIAAAVAALAALVLLWGARESTVAPPAAAQVAPALAPTAPRVPAAAAASQSAALVSGGAAAPSLPAGAPFRDQDLAMTAEGPDGPDVVLRSSERTGDALAIELGTRRPLGDGVRLFATISVSDGLGNTVIDCTWRDIELRGDGAHDLHCELPAGVALPLTISGHQRPAPSFIESPNVVAIDQRAH